MKTSGVEGSYTVFKIEGKSWGSASFSQEAMTFIGEAPMLILDVEDLNFDSMLIGELVVLQRELTQYWGDTPSRLAVVNLNEFSQRVFGQVKLDHILHFYPTVSDALKDQ